jgi:C_GCAxxG_C_C family probable redox protein
MTKEEICKKAEDYFDEKYACATSVLLAYAKHFNFDENTAKLISSTFGGGMGRLREKCGALTGSFMVLGLAFGNSNPNDMETKLNAYSMVRDLNQRFVDEFGTSICCELLEKYSNQEEVLARKHHTTICRRLVSETAGMVFEIIEKK